MVHYLHFTCKRSYSSQCSGVIFCKKLIYSSVWKCAISFEVALIGLCILLYIVKFEFNLYKIIIFKIYFISVIIIYYKM